MEAERRFRAMGTGVHLRVVGARVGAAERAQRRICDLERRWSRFRPQSEISRLNRCGETPCEVSPATITLVQRSIDAWRMTGGLFDPTVHDAVLAAGYRDSGGPPTAAVATEAPTPSRGMRGVAVNAEAGTVTLPRGVRIDAGGIGKGLAADIVANELRAEGARGALVNIGGDLRVLGDAAPARGWVIAIEDPVDARREVARVLLGEGAVATSTRARRRWRTTDGRTAHHLIDPRSGAPAWPDAVQASVIAGEAWWAEALATATFLLGTRRGPRMLTEVGAAGLVVDDRGGCHASPGLSEVLV